MDGNYPRYPGFIPAGMHGDHSAKIASAGRLG